MGHALMDKVLIHWSDLPGNAYKVLMQMAHTSLDSDLAPTYWGGWDTLAVMALGRRDWPADDDDSKEARATRRASFEIVRLAISDLKKAGAIKVAKRGKRGAQARYSLQLDSANLWTTLQQRKETLRDDARKPCATRKETLRTTQGKAGVEETKGTNKEKTGDETRSSPGDNSPTREATSQATRRLQLVRQAADAALAEQDQSSLEQGRPPTLTELLKEMSP